MDTLELFSVVPLRSSSSHRLPRSISFGHSSRVSRQNYPRVLSSIIPGPRHKSFTATWSTARASLCKVFQIIQASRRVRSFHIHAAFSTSAKECSELLLACHFLYCLKSQYGIPHANSPTLERKHYSVHRSNPIRLDYYIYNNPIYRRTCPSSTTITPIIISSVALLRLL